MRRPDSSIMANPILVGTTTLLTVLVALFITYNANNGLPFVPTYNVTAVMRDADLLGHNAEVRIGGKRVGLITGMTAERTRSGVALTRLALKLDTTASPLAVDTRVRVRPRSVIGLKYLELLPGHARKTIPPGGVIPPRNQLSSVDLQDTLNAFDTSTRRSVQQVTTAPGDGFAGRGASPNEAIQAFDPRDVVAVLPRASTRLASAVEVGTPVLRRADALADRLSGTLSALGTLVRDPATSGSVVELTRSLDALIPTLEFLNPAQVRCNTLGLYFRNAPAVISEGDDNGNWFRFLPLQNTPDNPQKGEVADNLHFDPYGSTGQNGHCV